MPLRCIVSLKATGLHLNYTWSEISEFEFTAKFSSPKSQSLDIWIWRFFVLVCGFFGSLRERTQQSLLAQQLAESFLNLARWGECISDITGRLRYNSCWKRPSEEQNTIEMLEQSKNCRQGSGIWSWKISSISSFTGSLEWTIRTWSISVQIFS